MTITRQQEFTNGRIKEMLTALATIDQMPTLSAKIHILTYVAEKAAFLYKKETEGKTDLSGMLGLMSCLAYLRQGLVHSCFKLTDEKAQAELENFIKEIIPELIPRLQKNLFPDNSAEKTNQFLENSTLEAKIKNSECYKRLILTEGNIAPVDLPFLKDLSKIMPSQQHTLIGKALGYYAEGFPRLTLAEEKGSREAATHYLLSLCELLDQLEQLEQMPCQTTKDYRNGIAYIKSHLSDFPFYNVLPPYWSALRQISPDAVKKLVATRGTLAHSQVLNRFSLQELIGLETIIKKDLGILITNCQLQPLYETNNEDLKNYIHKICTENDTALKDNLVKTLHYRSQNGDLAPILNVLSYRELDVLNQMILTEQFNDVAFNGLKMAIKMKATEKNMEKITSESNSSVAIHIPESKFSSDSGVPVVGSSILLGSPPGILKSFLATNTMAPSFSSAESDSLDLSKADSNKATEVEKAAEPSDPKKQKIEPPSAPIKPPSTP